MNDKNHQHHDIKDSVLEKITKGEVHMRPKVYFVLKLLLLVFVALCTLVVSSYIISYIIFSIIISGRDSLLGFGSRGILAFFVTFPWPFLLADVLLLFFFEWLLQHFSFGYHRPFIYLLLVGALLSVGAGLFINSTSLNRTLMVQTQHQGLPVLGPFYEHVRRPTPGRDIFIGVVTDIQGDTCMVKADDHDTDRDDGMRTVIAPPNMYLEKFLNIGDTVFVAGDDVGGVIHAYGITKISPSLEE